MQGILKKLAVSSARPPARMSIESGAFTFHYLIDSDVVYLSLAEKAYPKKLAFQYLEELQSEFSRLYGAQTEAVTRPYAFIKFGGERCRLPGAAELPPTPACLLLQTPLSRRQRSCIWTPARSAT